MVEQQISMELKQGSKKSFSESIYHNDTEEINESVKQKDAVKVQKKRRLLYDGENTSF